MHFRPTLPAETPELARASAFQRQWLDDTASGGETLGSRAAALGPSLLQDLMRFERDGHKGELLEVLAACLRHGRALLVHLQIVDRMLPLAVHPRERLIHMPISFERFCALPLGELRVLSFEPPTTRPPESGRTWRGERFEPLAPLLWELALRGSRDELLPEIAGHAAYRIAPGTDLDALRLAGSLADAARRLQGESYSLREIAAWPGFDRQRAMRMLNGLYLQAGLMVSRTHPAAIGEPRPAPAD